MQAPMAALVLMLELTRTTVGLVVPMVVATAIATTVGRYLDGYSIYSSRLAAHPLPDDSACRATCCHLLVICRECDLSSALSMLRPSGEGVDDGAHDGGRTKSERRRFSAH
jgi:hypothetical protein